MQQFLDQDHSSLHSKYPRIILDFYWKHNKLQLILFFKNIIGMCY